LGRAVVVIVRLAATVTVELPDAVVSATLVALTVTEAGLGGVAGAVYSPLVEIVPTVEFPPVTPFTDQVTPVLVVFVTVAVNCWAPEVWTEALAGETETDTAAITVAVAVAVWVESVVLVAATVTVGGEGWVAGAVYSPLEETVPTVELPPATPFTFQATLLDIFVAVAVNCCVPDVWTDALAGDIERDVIAATVTAADADLDGSAILVAETVTVAGEGTIDGAVYNPLVETVPTVEFPPAIPFADHVTPVFVALLTLAVNCFVAEVWTEALVGETETETAAITVAVAVAVFVGSATLVPAIVTVAGEGKPAGAVYSPVDEIVPVVEFPPAVPFTDHVTLVLDELLTLAVNCCVPDSWTEALAGETETDTADITVTDAEADFFGSATLVAAIVTVAGEGKLDGAVYNPLAEILPLVELPPATPFTDQVTLVSEFVLATAAVNCIVPTSRTEPLVGETLMVTTGVTVTCARADFFGSATLVTVTVTVDGDGTDAGAVYRAVVRPVDETVPTEELPPVTPFTVHTTLSLVVPRILAVNAWEPPVGMDEVEGPSLTVIAARAIGIARRATRTGIDRSRGNARGRVWFARVCSNASIFVEQGLSAIVGLLLSSFTKVPVRIEQTPWKASENTLRQTIRLGLIIELEGLIRL
jgi:hypothetical protein